MEVQEFLNKVAYIDEMEIGGELAEVWMSKFDNSYMTHVGMEDHVKFLADLEITEELTHGVGFSPKYNKWYGWSHRAIYGFEIGSTCEKGDVHYRAENLHEEIQAAIRFWTDEDTSRVLAEPIKPGEIRVYRTHNDNIPNKDMRGKTSILTWNYDHQHWGRGEWTAKTMEDAKQMAIDFCEGVS